MRRRRTSPPSPIETTHGGGAALGRWPALAARRWSLVDQLDTDGRRFVLAQTNTVQVRRPRALTQREREVAAYAALGCTNKLIAYTLGATESTVATELARAKRKLAVRSRLELIRRFGLSQRPASLALLAPAERTVAALIVRGSSNEAIARLLGRSPRTVANQVVSILRKLNLTSRYELAARVA